MDRYIREADGDALAAVEKALRVHDIEVKRVNESEFFIGLSYERGGTVLAAVCHGGGLHIEEGGPGAPWETSPHPDPSTYREKALIRAHAALYYGLS